MGPEGRHPYSTATKLTAIECACLRYPDGGVVGSRGAAAGLGQGVCPKLVIPVYSFEWLDDD